MAYYKSAHCVIEGAVEIGADASIWHYAVVRGDEDSITIGARTNVQDGAVLHVDEGWPLSIGSGVTIGHRAVVHGCTIEDDVLVGMGAHRHERRKDRPRQHHRSRRRRPRRRGDPARFSRHRRARKSPRQRPPRTAPVDSGKRPALRRPGRKAP